MENVRTTEMEDMEVMTPLQLMNDSYYGPMQLMTYMAASEGDVYLLPRDEFVTLAAQGSLLPLENDKELMALFDQAGINLQNGKPNGLNGYVFDLAKPPVIDLKTGERGYPGQCIGCSCFLVPVE